METSSHLLALKVMRVSRPILSGQWQPFSTLPSFDAYASQNVTSIQQHSPHLDRRPSTTRDYNTLSPLMSLPSNFGTISLGETFTSVLCLTNGTNSQVEGVSIQCSLSSTSTKTILLETPPTSLGPLPPQSSPLTEADPRTNTSSLEALISAEIKDLGQHTLTCVISYVVPAQYRLPAPSEDPSDPRRMVFRKHYRFPVTNPFNVKTKSHVPRSPSMLMDRKEREKVFLEVHVQNLTSEAMAFERLDFKPLEGWMAEDSNILEEKKALIHPQETKQYTYTLLPSSIPNFPTKPVPGHTVPLGRLDMAWRSTLGEPGRLLTSVLSRRVPAASVPTSQAPPIPALPPHVQRAIQQIPRPRSPTPSISSVVSSTPTTASNPIGSRPGSPAPGVPYKSRTPRPQTPIQTHNPPLPLSLPIPNQTTTQPATDVQVDLIVDDTGVNEEGAILDEPFTMNFMATVAAYSSVGRKRNIKLGIQHVIHSARLKTASSSHTQTIASTKKKTVPNVAGTPRHSPLPSATSTPRIQSIDFAHPRPTALAISPKPHRSHHARPFASVGKKWNLPSPYSEETDPTVGMPGNGKVEFLGSSFLELPPFLITEESEPVDVAPWGTTVGIEAGPISPTSTSVGQSGNGDRRGSATTIAIGGGAPERKRIASQEFTLDFVPTKLGLANVGGVRLLLLSDQEGDLDMEDGEGTAKRESILGTGGEAKVLHEWAVVGEVWVRAA